MVEADRYLEEKYGVVFCADFFDGFSLFSCRQGFFGSFPGLPFATPAGVGLIAESLINDGIGFDGLVQAVHSGRDSEQLHNCIPSCVALGAPATGGPRVFVECVLR
jgi:hypothetical protein